MIVLGPGDAFVAGEIDIRRGGASMGVYGNPLEMRMEGDRAAVDELMSKDQEGRRYHVRRHIVGAQAGAARLHLQWLAPQGVPRHKSHAGA